MKLTFRNIVGLAGVPSHERLFVRRLGTALEWAMLVIAFWLPIELYLRLSNQFSLHSNIVADWWVWGAFVFETLILVCLVKKKLHYLLSNWLNLLLIIIICPMWIMWFAHNDTIRIIRMLILFRVILPWVTTAHRALTLNRVGLTLVVFLITTTLSGLLVSMFDSGIRNPFIGVWWAWETVTTVGYGDVIPVSPLGKIVAMFIMLMGIVLFSIVTASVSAYFVGKDQSSQLTGLRRDSHRIALIERYLGIQDTLDNLSNEQAIDKWVAKLTEKEKKYLLKKLQKELNN